MVTKTYLPTYLCDRSDSCDSCDSCDTSDSSVSSKISDSRDSSDTCVSSESSDSRDSSDTSDSSDSYDSSDNKKIPCPTTFFPKNLFHQKIQEILFFLEKKMSLKILKCDKTKKL